MRTRDIYSCAVTLLQRFMMVINYVTNYVVPTLCGWLSARALEFTKLRCTNVILLRCHNDSITLSQRNVDVGLFTGHCPFLDLDIYITNGKLNTKIYDKRNDFSFPIVN